MSLSINHEKLIVELLVTWFPFLGKALEFESCYIFGGVIREMLLAANSYNPKGSLSVKNTIRYYMYNYFKNGGDVDFYTSRLGMYHTCEIDLGTTSMEFSSPQRESVYYGKKIGQISAITPQTPKYEISTYLKRLKRTQKEDVEEYGSSNIKTTRLEDVFETDHYKLTVLVDICSEIGEPILVQVDLICPSSTSTIPKNFMLRCDFSCNLATIANRKSKSKDSQLALKFNAENCNSITQYLELLDKKVLRVLPYNIGINSCKLIHRLAIRMEKGWKIDETDKMTIKTLTKYLCYAISSSDDMFGSNEQLKAQEEENKIHSKFVKAMGPEIFAMFNICKSEIKTVIFTTNQKASEFYDKYILSYLQELCIKNNNLEEFISWAKDCVDFNINPQQIISQTIEYMPREDSITRVLTLFPFQTNADAVHFFCELMRFDREEEFTQKIRSPNGAKFIKIFNSSSSETKLKSRLITDFFEMHYNQAPFNVKYMKILDKCGMILPKIPVEYKVRIYDIVEINRQSTELLQFLYSKGLISQAHLFLDKSDKTDKTDYYSSYLSDCVEPSAANIKWLSSMSWFTFEHVERMAKTVKFDAINDIDFEFLATYKTMAIKHGKIPETYEHLFMRLFERNDWNLIEQYFVYRFGTQRPKFNQITSLNCPGDYRSSSIGQYNLRHGQRNDVFKSLILTYGPHLFMGVLDEMFSKYSTYHGYNSTDWLYVVYWLWRISFVTKSAWMLPKEIIQKIVGFYHSDSDSYDGHEIRSKNVEEWQIFKQNLNQALNNKLIPRNVRQY